MDEVELTRLEALEQTEEDAEIIGPAGRELARSEALKALPALIAEVRRLRALWDAIETIEDVGGLYHLRKWVDGWRVDYDKRNGRAVTKQRLAAALIALAGRIKEGE